MKILIVDDSKAMRMIVKRTLRQAGFDGHSVVEAENGALAYKEIGVDPPDLVLSDWNMPEMTGIELAEKLQAEESRVPLGFITTEGTPEMRERASAAGAKFLIVKPFTPDSFKQALSPILG